MSDIIKRSGWARRRGALVVVLCGTSIAAAVPSVVPAAAPSATQRAAQALPLSLGARLVVANAGEGGRIDVFDGVGEAAPGFGSVFDEDDVVVAADVTGDDEVEVISLNGTAVNGPGFVAVYDVASGEIIPEHQFFTEFDSGDRAATGDVNGDGVEELLIGDDEGGSVDVLDIVTGEPLEGFGITDTTLDDDPGNGFAVGDVDNDGRVEVFVANRSGGRIDVLDPGADETKDGFFIEDTTFNNGDSPEMAVGDVDGDGRVEVLIANTDFGGRIDVLDPTAPGEPKDGFGIEDTTFNNTGDNQFKVADVDADGRAEALIANADEDGRIDVLDPVAPGGPKGAPFGVETTGFDTDDVFAVSNFGTGDLDGDGIPDRVELNGIRNANGDVVLDLQALGASPCRKDIIVEIDYMVDDSGDSDDHDHKPIETDTDGDGIAEFPALDEVRAAFETGRPVDGIDPCPYRGADNGDGINLVNIVGDAIDEQSVVDLEPGANGRSELDQLKIDHFDSALDPFVHWSLWLHDIQEDDETGNPSIVDASGLASPGDTDFTDDQDFVLTDSSGSHSPGDQRLQAVVYMHELGHVIGLRHGGDRNVNCKPNYLSVMNYSFSTTGLSTADGQPTASGKQPNFVDFSGQELTPDGGLDENGLDEIDGVGGPAVITMWTDKSGNPQTGDASRPLDWSGDDDDGVDADGETGTADDPDVEADLNVRLDANGDNICEPNNATDEPLAGFNDWAKLNVSVDPVPFSAINDDGDVEPTQAQMTELQTSWDEALSPDLDAQLEPPRAGFQGNVLGIDVDDEHVYAIHGHRSTANPPVAGPRGTLVVLDRQTMTVESRITVGFGPSSVAVNPLTNRAYVVNRGKDSLSVSVIDTARREVVDEIKIGQVPIDVAVNTRLNRVYVSNPFQQRIEVIDGATNTKVAAIPVGPAHGLALDETTDTVYATLTRRPNNPLPPVTALGTVIDDGTNSPQVLPQVDLSGVFEPVDVAVDPTGERIYVATQGNPVDKPAVVVLNQATRQQIALIKTRGPVRALGLNPDTPLVFAAGDRGIDVIDATSSTIVREMNPGIVFSVATGTGTNRQVFAGDFITGQLHRLSPSSGTPR